MKSLQIWALGSSRAGKVCEFVILTEFDLPVLNILTNWDYSRAGNDSRNLRTFPAREHFLFYSISLQNES